MNERIEELMKQSMIEVRSHGAFGENERYQKLDPQKFAELIIQECMKIAFEYDAPKLSGPGMIIANTIEDHFGVESNV